MEQTNKRLKFTGAEKLKILEEGRQDGISLSHVCKKYGISLSVYYQWEKKAREAMKEALSDNYRGRKKIDHTEDYDQEIRRLKEVIVEISASNIELKKTLSR